MELERRRVSDQIVDELRRRIVTGAWADGERLPTERELSTEFGVSPNTVREAIRALGALGLVEVRRGSGAFVRLEAPALVASSLGTVMRLEGVPLDDALGLSHHLHLRVVELAVERATEADVERLLAASAAPPVPGFPENAPYATEFLTALVRCANEPLLAAIATTLDRLLVESIRGAYRKGDDRRVPELRGIRDEWGRIAAAVRDRDLEAARRAVADYTAAARRITERYEGLRGARVRQESWRSALEDVSISGAGAPAPSA